MIAARLCFFAAVTAWAQIPASIPEISASNSGPVFSTGANLVPVKVVVRDKNGRAVENLAKTDFTLKDQGKIQEISRFSAVKSEIPADRVATALDSTPSLRERSNLPPIVIPTRFIAYIFDDVHTDIADLMRAREAGVKTLQEVMDPTTRAAVYSTSGQVRQDFTGDIEALTQAMRSIRRWSADPGRNDCLPMTYYWADKIINYADTMAFNLAADDYMACHQSSLTGDQSTIDMVNTAVRAAALQSLNEGQRQTRYGFEIIDTVARRMSVLPGDRFVLMVSGGFYVDQTLRTFERQVLETLSQNKVMVNALDARGVYTVSPATDIAQRGLARPDLTGLHMSMLRETALQQGNVLGELARGSGGTFISNTNGFEDGYRKLTALHELTYMLAFSPKDMKYDGKYHKLDVVLNSRPGLDVKSMTVTARAGYFAPSSKSRSDQAIKGEIREAVFAREEVVTVPLEMDLKYSRAERAVEAHLFADLKIGIDGLRLRKGKDFHTDSLIIVTAVFDYNGIFVKGVEHAINLKMRDDVRAKFQEKGGIDFRSEVLIPPGNYIVRVVLRDSEGNALTSRNGAVEIPD